ncbi:MAG: hypothetical protein E5X34_29775 [Mesorhizobium sp.]|uniref:hypothetical protein n=1 Tax=Mesorhizobium sp. TaxID=1871066 RepID=UPI0012123631|nr:hypothetical protein [Mesorhizobium sp.]TIR15285.1 MAG: hypothetical protein E5X34_29775 [Mesorhizobium sp.]
MTGPANTAALFENNDASSAPKPRVSRAERRLMEIQRALKRALIRERNVLAAVEIAANAIFEIGRLRKIRNFDPFERLRKWCERRGLKVSSTALTAITEKWRDAGYLMSVEDVGALLSLTPKQRVENQLWTLGARGETAQQRRERKEQRQADARAKKRKADRERVSAARRAEGAQPRAQFEARSTAEFCRKHGISRDSFESARKRGRLEAFLQKRGISETPPRNAQTSVAVESIYSSATHLGASAISLGGRPHGRPTAMFAYPDSVRRAHLATMLDRAANALAAAPRRTRPRATT